MESTSITFSPALPCLAIKDDDQLCGRPATVGALYPHGAGAYILQPFCKECVAGMARVSLGPPNVLEDLGDEK